MLYISSNFLDTNPYPKQFTPHAAKPADKSKDTPIGELWVMIIEKALAKLMGGYKNIDGGKIKDVLPILIGEDCKSYQAPEKGDKEDIIRDKEIINEVINIFSNSQNNITIGTHSYKTMKDDHDYPLIILKQETEDCQIVYNETTKLYGSHAYLVSAIQLTYDADKNVTPEKSIITLRNPHNKVPTENDGNVTSPQVSLAFIAEYTNITYI